VPPAKSKAIDKNQIVLWSGYDCPVKRKQALLGSILSRDSRVQVALNNAQEGNSNRCSLFPSSFLLFKPSCPCLKKPYKIDARSASDFFYPIPSFILAALPSISESTLIYPR
jgi:hypothetical protein